MEGNQKKFEAEEAEFRKKWGLPGLEKKEEKKEEEDTMTLFPDTSISSLSIFSLL